jgi:lipopolysaccharide export system protein LptA
LDYSGANGRAVYTGDVALVQNQTAIRGDALTLDQQRGDLVASGSARSTLMLDGGRTEGRAHEIRYDEASRVVTYSAVPVVPTTAQGRVEAAPSAGLSHVVGPDGDLRAERIEIVLGRDGNQVQRLEAHNRVTLALGTRGAAGTRLTYHTDEGRYVMSSSGTTPVTLREACRETTGRTVTFFKSSDRIVVDGDDTSRTETRPCTAPASR